MPSYSLTASESASLNGVEISALNHTLTGVKQVRIDETLGAGLVAAVRNLGCVAAKIVYLSITNSGTEPITALTVDAGIIDLPLAAGESLVVAGAATCAAFCAAWSAAATFEDLKITTVGAGAHLEVLVVETA